MLSPIDLYDVRFWLFVAVAASVLNALVHQYARKWAFALMNLAFVYLYLNLKMTLAMLASLLVVACLWLMRSGRTRSAAAILGGLWLLILFVFHKRSDLFVERVPPLQHLESFLSTIGFSYVALRIYELGRAVGEGRHEAPGFASTVNYLLPFHMLVAGPIQSYDEFITQAAVPPPLKAVEALDAFDRIAGGLFKKYVLASLIQKVFLTDYRASGPYVLRGATDINLALPGFQRI